MKHCLIIPCSGAKTQYEATAFNLYNGVLMDVIRTFDLSFVLKHFDIFFISAKHGLIHSDMVIKPYDKEMLSDVN
jgi:hypothetical protein